MWAGKEGLNPPYAAYNAAPQHSVHDDIGDQP
ncbi:hypothetical protein SAMN05444680_12021 [Variovorax sp. YR216]|nr:hypothetical protein SAMN05444680_12021 [Variovorax sp. YR216]